MYLKRIALALTVIAASVAATAMAQERANDYYAQDGPNDYYQSTNYVDAAADQSYSDGGYASCCDDGCGSGCDNCCCGPRWKFQAGALVLHRERPSRKPIVVGHNTASDPLAPLVFANELNLDWQTGWELAAQRELNCDWAVEFRYFQVNDMQDQISVGPTTLGSGGIGFNPNDGIGEGIFGGSTIKTATLQYDSDLWNLEMNLKRRLGCASIIAGFRYFNLDEQVRLNVLSSSTATNNLFYATDNDLYGFQLGLEGSLTPECWGLQVDYAIKTGVYHNDITLRNGRTFSLGADTNNRLDDTHTAFLGEVDLIASYALGCNWSVRGGVELMWIEGVAVATDQITNNPATTTPPTTVDTNGSPFYTGLMLGLEYRR